MQMASPDFGDSHLHLMSVLHYVHRRHRRNRHVHAVCTHMPYMVHKPYRKTKGTQIETVGGEVCLYNIIMSSLDYVFSSQICTLHVRAVYARTYLEH